MRLSWKKRFQCECLGTILYLSIFFSILISGLFWLVGFVINGWVFPLAFTASSVYAYKKFGSVNLELPVAVILILGSILIGAVLPDASWDGQAYHQPAIYALSHEWNPVRQPHVAIALDVDIWINHYAKGLETAGATIVALTGNLESGKAINFLFGLSAFFYLIPFLKRILYPKGGSSKRVCFYAFLLAFPNILFCQFLTFCIDYVAYYLILWLLVGFVGLYRKVDIRHSYILVFASVFMAVTIKFNMLFWAGYATFFYLVYLLFKKRYFVMKPLAFVCLVSVLTALLTSGFNPYITNSVAHHNPIYPLGISSENIEYLANDGVAKSLAGKGRMRQAVESLFSRPNDGTVGYIPIYKIVPMNVKIAGGAGARVGGGGFFFVDLIIITLFVLLAFRKGKHYSLLLSFSLITFSTLFILPFGSLHRYVPYVYFIPIATLIYIDMDYHKKWLSYLYSLLLVLNIFITFSTAFAMNLLYKYSSEYYISQIKQNHIAVKTMNWSFLYKLNGNKCDKNDRFFQTRDTIGHEGYMMPLNRSFTIYLKDNEKLDKPFLIRKLEGRKHKPSSD